MRSSPPPHIAEKRQGVHENRTPCFVGRARRESGPFPSPNCWKLNRGRAGVERVQGKCFLAHTGRVRQGVKSPHREPKNAEGGFDPRPHNEETAQPLS